MNRYGDRNEKCMDLGSEIYRNNYVNIDGNVEILEIKYTVLFLMD